MTGARWRAAEMVVGAVRAAAEAGRPGQELLGSSAQVAGRRSQVAADQISDLRAHGGAYGLATGRRRRSNTRAYMGIQGHTWAYMGHTCGPRHPGGSGIWALGRAARRLLACPPPRRAVDWRIAGGHNGQYSNSRRFAHSPIHCVPLRPTACVYRGLAGQRWCQGWWPRVEALALR